MPKRRQWCGIVPCLAVVLCVGVCVVLHPVKAQQDPQCSCHEGCGTDGIESADGRKVNVAYGKPAIISSLYTSNEPSGPACAAVNGRTNTFYVWRTKIGKTNCVHSAGDDYKAWWEVNLGASYPVESITIYGRENGAQRMANITVYVDSATCHEFPADTRQFPEKNEVTCGQSLTGSTVALRKKETSYAGERFINICEVQVWVCVNGTYGSDCASTCGNCSGDGVCNKVNGTCPDGCQPGFDPSDLLCKQPCTNGTYGQNCTSTCGGCSGDPVCNKVDGVCPDGCQAGFYHNDTRCQTLCTSGTYGQNCASTCGNCSGDGVCNKANGTCPDGCQPGFDPSDHFCKQRCANGTYGQNCASTCGNCSGDGVCNNVNGTCPDGCQPGFDPNEARCKTSCTSGTYGQNCASICGDCSGDSVCHKVTGTCPDGCQPGFNPSDLLCKQPCANGTYGQNCTSTCGNCSGDGVCHKVAGTCPDGCQPGFDPSDLLCKQHELMKTGDDDNNLGLIAGATVGGIVFIIVIILIIVLFLRCRRKKKVPSSSTDTLTSLSSIPSRPSKDSSLSFEPIPNRKAPKTPTKPTITVKPMNKARQADMADDASHYYANVQAPASTSRASQDTIETTLTLTDGNQADEAADYDLTEEDRSLDDMYLNSEEVYASFKATQPELDTVQSYLVDRLASGQLPTEFASMAKGDDNLTSEAAALRVNWKKNRFASILPYDHNRVVLTDGYTGHGATDFVNASYISGHQSSKHYIASQGPRDNTVWDMWRTIWQDNITVIVMLTRLKEGERNKCHRYWPEEEDREETYGPVTVTTGRVQYRDSFCVRTFSVRKNGETRKVTQYHYLAWPDHGAPTVTSLVSFWRHVSQRSGDSSTPVLVHCSAGVGRTGTYIGLDLGMALAVSEGHLDLPALVRRLRAERVLMVQSVEQYLFLYKALLEAYTARDTVLTVEDMDHLFPHHISPTSPHPRLDKEFQSLMQLQKLTPGHCCQTATQPDNMAKNRHPDILPADHSLVFLTERVPGRNQYINAVFMRTFHHSRGSILTQRPLPSTVVDFWRLVYGNDVTTIVSLTSPEEEKELKNQDVHWPQAEGKKLQSGPYTVTLISTQPLQGAHLMTYTLSLAKKGESSARTVQLYRYSGWRGEVGGEVGEVLCLMDTLLSASPPPSSPSASPPPPPLLLQCSDGVTKSGMFAALYDVTTRVTYDREVDVFMAVRHVQTVMPAAVTSSKQYRYCYEVAQTRVHEMSVYANT